MNFFFFLSFCSLSFGCSSWLLFLLGYYGVYVFPPTRECSLVGGICVQEQDCSPGETTSQKGLCSGHGDNIECCYAGTYHKYCHNGKLIFILCTYIIINKEDKENQKERRN